MNIERIIDEIEQIEEMFEAPDTRALKAISLSLAVYQSRLRRTAIIASLLLSDRGTHSELIRLSWEDFVRLVRPRVSSARTGIP